MPYRFKRPIVHSDSEDTFHSAEDGLCMPDRSRCVIAQETTGFPCVQGEQRQQIVSGGDDDELSAVQHGPRLDSSRDASVGDLSAAPLDADDLCVHEEALQSYRSDAVHGPG
jgi:hypothetical protein